MKRQQVRVSQISLVVVGIGLIATRGDLTAFRRPGGQVGVRWGTAIGRLIPSYTAVDAYAVEAPGIAPVILDWFSNLLHLFMLPPLVLANPNRALERMRGLGGSRSASVSCPHSPTSSSLPL